MKKFLSCLSCIPLDLAWRREPCGESQPSFLETPWTLAFESPCLFGAKLCAFHLVSLQVDQLPKLLFLLLTLSLRIGSHPSSFYPTAPSPGSQILLFQSLTPVQLILHLPTGTFHQPVQFFCFNDTVTFFISSDWDPVLHPKPLSYNNCCESM